MRTGTAPVTYLYTVKAARVRSGKASSSLKKCQSLTYRTLPELRIVDLIDTSLLDVNERANAPYR